ncbi:MAG: MFS transporter [Candidatus Omnitrophica bacterium]|nr:MFS transporter [Candidatus Omnitrophota bacterium]MCM8799125.1 MFS transporter [Candidatus Omnitrophota bacterium]
MEAKFKPLNFIIILGLVSLFADMVYEGARGVLSPFFFYLGASSLMTGFIFGIAEFLGWALRIFFGWFADRFKCWWQMTFLGYGLGVLSIPLLAFTKNLQAASILVIFERLGKAIRSPSRDLLISSVTEEFGRGKAFGLHEFFDQIGAISGPILVGILFFLSRDYRISFGFLFLPAIICLLVLNFAFKRYTLPFISEVRQKDTSYRKLPLRFWWYSFFTLFTVMGFLNFPLIAYHLKSRYILSESIISIWFGLGMGIDALTALVAGRLYDLKGLISLLSIPFLNIPLVFLGLSFNPKFILTAIILWGIIMGIQETIMRAEVADLVSIEKRGLAYGIFNSLYGLGIFLSLSIMGFLYRFSFNYIITFTIITQIISLPFLFLIKKEES